MGQTGCLSFGNRASHRVFLGLARARVHGMLGHTLAKTSAANQTGVFMRMQSHATVQSPNWAFQRTLTHLIALRALPGRH